MQLETYCSNYIIKKNRTCCAKKNAKNTKKASRGRMVKHLLGHFLDWKFVQDYAIM